MALLSQFLSWLMLSAGCWLAAEVINGFRLPRVASAALVAAAFGLANTGVGWVAHGMISQDWFWLRPPLAFLLRCAADAVLVQGFGLLLPRVVQLRHFGTAVLAALVMSGFGTAGEVFVDVLLWIPLHAPRGQ